MKKTPKASPNIVLAIDPATVDSGWAVVSRDMTVTGYGLIHCPASWKVERRLKGLYDSLVEIIDQHNIELIVIEDQFLGSNVNTIKALSWARGVIMLLAAQREIEILIINNKTAKKRAKKGNATKTEVKKAVLQKYKLEGDLDENITDAMAIGLAYFCQWEEAT